MGYKIYRRKKRPSSFINSLNLFDGFAELAGLIYLIVLFILIIDIISTPQKFRRLLNIFLFISTIVSLIGLILLVLSLITGKMLDSRFLFYSTIESMAHHFPRINLTFETPNMMLSYLHVALILGAILFLSEKRIKARYLILSSIVIILIAAIFTGSRQFTGFILSLFIILCCFGKGRIASILKYLTFLGVIFFLAVTVITSIWVIFPVKVRNEENTKNISLKANCAYSMHFIPPIASINMVKKYPLVGVGFGTYNRNIKDNVDWKWVRDFFGFEAYPQYRQEIENETLNFDPHSLFLGALAEAGLIGFMGLMFFLIKYMALLVKRFRNSKRYSLENIVSGCVLAGFIGFLLNGLTTDILSMRHLWIMMAIGITITSYETKECN